MNQVFLEKIRGRGLQGVYFGLEYVFCEKKINWITKLPPKPICNIVYLTIILSSPFNHDDRVQKIFDYYTYLWVEQLQNIFFCLQFQDSLHLTDKINACQGHGQTQNKNPYIWDWSVVFGSTLSLVDSDI